jgi:hypothetical protein
MLAAQPGPARIHPDQPHPWRQQKPLAAFR